MAPNKFEKHLKDTLERRTIVPSTNAWSQLDNALEAQKNKRKFPMWWLGIAATLVGVFLAILFIDNEVKQPDAIVDEVINEVITPNKINTIEKAPIVIEDTNEVEDVKEEIVIVKKKKIVPKNTQNTTLVASNNTENNIKEEFIQTPNNAIIIPVKKEEITNIVVAEETVSSKEATLLLDEAYSAVKANQTTYKSEKIDANSLLEEVEIQSEKSLKNRLFHAVKSGFETVKTAVVERHN